MSDYAKRAAVRERLEQQAESERSLPCRVCSECDGHHHTSTEYAEFDEQSNEFIGYGCKHCDEKFPECPSCGGPEVDGECRGECGDDE